MKLNNLYLHCGGAQVEREELERVETPEACGRWQPIAHDELAGQVRRGLENVRVFRDAFLVSTRISPLEILCGTACCRKGGVPQGVEVGGNVPKGIFPLAASVSPTAACGVVL